MSASTVEGLYKQARLDFLIIEWQFSEIDSIDDLHLFTCVWNRPLTA